MSRSDPINEARTVIAARGISPGKRGWVLIENEGALFRGPGRGNPKEVWGGSGWEPYAGASRSRDVEWGNVIDEIAAADLLAS